MSVWTIGDEVADDQGFLYMVVQGPHPGRVSLQSLLTGLIADWADEGSIMSSRFMVTIPAATAQVPTSGIIGTVKITAPVIQYGPGPAPSPVYKMTMDLGKPLKTRKQVSHNGKDWCDYRLLLDADDFESYQYRREI